MRTFKGYLDYFNILERNIIFCLCFARHRKEYTQNIEKFSGLSFDQKVRKLKNLIKSKKLDPEFTKWFETVDKIRVMRNRLVHGYWRFVWHVEEPVVYDIPAPSSEKGQMSLEAFVEEFEQLKKATDSFSQLRKLHEGSLATIPCYKLNP